MKRGKIAILGGTGALGSGLARRLATAGWHVLIGSRDAVRAGEFAASLGASNIQGTSFAEAAEQSDLAILTVPFASQSDVIAAVASHLAGKVLIDATVPLKPPKVSMVQLPKQARPLPMPCARRAQKCGWCRLSRMSVLNCCRMTTRSIAMSW